MSTFVTPVPAGASIQRVAPSAPVPSAPVPSDPVLRFAGDPVYWVGLPAGTAISAFATGCVARVSGATDGIPGSPLQAWTAFQLSPLPQMDPAAFKLIIAGLPVQMVLILGSAGPVPAADDVLDCGAPLVTAPAGAGSTAFLGFVFQDRLTRDPLSAAEAIAASGACDAGWPGFMAALAALPHGRNFRVLDHRGAPITGLSLGVTVGAGSVQTFTLDDGDSGVDIPAGSSVLVTTPGASNAIIGGGDADIGSFQAGLALPAGRRLVQVLSDAGAWLAEPDPGVSLPRWHANSHIEPIQDGTPYFRRLVTDVRSAKGGGKAEIAGWAVVKGSLTDSALDWPLIPEDASTTILALVNELRGSGSGTDIRLLLNRFVQFDNEVLDDFPELIPIVFAVLSASAPLHLLLELKTDAAGYAVGFIAVAGLLAAFTTPVTAAVVKKIAELSQTMKDALDEIDPAIATWTPYPCAFADNPLVAPAPFKVLGHTIDDISHFGVYHQKLVAIKPASGDTIAYLGGIDLNSDRPDTPLHRAKHPFHDLQVRVTGPAVESVVRTYQERATVHFAPVPIPAEAVPSPPGASHLVQIARTYYKPASPPGKFNDFAPHGESTPTRTITAAIGQAKDFIYIEDQYFTPSDDYVQALLDAAGRGVRALMITMPFASDQPYGSVRRAQILAALTSEWGDRIHIGAPLRRFLHEVPGLTTNLGRLALTDELNGSAAVASFAPPGRVPAPPFWAFIGNELVLVHALFGAATATKQPVEIARAAGAEGWGAKPVTHPAGTPVLAVQLPHIYVHAKTMIVDDIFLFAGSSNVNRRSHYHDGELNSFTIPQHLMGDARNPARLLRARLMAEHLGLSTEMGQALFADPHSALRYFKERSWYEQSRWRGLDFFGSLPPDVPIGTSGSLPMFLLQILIGSLRDAAKPDVWPLIADPTSGLDPHPHSKGPDYP
jgi:phosphatidylserine/phosphatidylglycerophosphate/cardiolipin synthase-like enzyme